MDRLVMESSRKMVWQWSDGRLDNVAMDGLRWTARRNERLGNGRLGDKALDGSAMLRWTACDVRLGDGAMDGSMMS